MTDFSTNYTDSSKPPLSQGPAKKKLLIALPLSSIGAVMWWVNVPGGMTLCILLGAYALTGAVEIFGGVPLIEAAKNWEALPGWKKGLVSILVISAAIIGLFLTIFIYAKMTGSA
ncbi:hypothetical protein [Rugamonas sp. DEMB1]|uniref:hypothetical protein n=1 Tax=Rugamonas sp. DEMB1 TaxID=3039386 RepID=UPI00244B5AD2|nr:hypothetical protein [Rugamonas sp. DEMB1]WGG48712.1 hypothetical protein QC826_18855 [Rugamonas sp. DEMB1]